MYNGVHYFECLEHGRHQIKTNIPSSLYAGKAPIFRLGKMKYSLSLDKISVKHYLRFALKYLKDKKVIPKWYI